jgi:hypothetical protein
MMVRWKPRGQDKFFLVLYPSLLLLLAILQALMGKPMWGSLGIAALLSVPMAWIMGKLSSAREIGLEGRRLSIDRDRWDVEDVDSVAIGPQSVRVVVYRAGRAGSEFTAAAKEMDGETWRRVRECCGRIEEEVGRLRKL